MYDLTVVQTTVAEEERHMPREWQFQSLLEALPSQVSAGTARNLSVPIAFVCLLHLANEKVRCCTVYQCPHHLCLSSAPSQ